MVTVCSITNSRHLFTNFIYAFIEEWQYPHPHWLLLNNWIVHRHILLILIQRIMEIEAILCLTQAYDRSISDSHRYKVVWWLQIQEKGTTCQKRKVYHQFQKKQKAQKCQMVYSHLQVHIFLEPNPLPCRSRTKEESDSKLHASFMTLWV